MSIKVHFLHSHLDRFAYYNLGDYSEGQGERFHQDTKVRWDRHMMQTIAGASNVIVLINYIVENRTKSVLPCINLCDF